MAKKRYIILILLSITIMLITASCSQNGSTKDSSTSETPDNHTEQSSNTTTNKIDDLAGKTHTETAYILDIDLENNTIMIGPSLNTDYESQTCVFIKEDTDILINLANSNIEKLAVGNAILITYTGGIAESAPAQMHHPVKIEVVKTTTKTAYILDINLEYNYIMIGEAPNTDYWMQDKVLLKENTRILINGVSSKLEDLAIGNQILITSDGSILESAPAQIPWTFQIEVVK